MDLTWDDLLVHLDDYDTTRLLAEWRWLIDDDLSVVIVTTMGDALVTNGDGTIFFLDTVDARIQRVADSYDQLKELMVQPDNYSRWFLPKVIEEFKTAGMSLGPTQCFSPYVQPIIGGQVTPDNYHATDLAVHFTVVGALHRSVKELPPGTPISGIDIEWSD